MERGNCCERHVTLSIPWLFLIFVRLGAMGGNGISKISPHLTVSLSSLSVDRLVWVMCVLMMSPFPLSFVSPSRALGL